MALDLPIDKTPPQQLQVSWVDAEGNPTTVDGPTTWSSSNDAAVTVTADATDSTLATLDTPQGAPLGGVQISAKADADRGPGITEIVAILDVNVIAGQAVSGTIAPVP